MVINESLKNIYRGKKVLVTGAYGFKGSWLCYWLNELGADVLAYSLHPMSELKHYPLLNLSGVHNVEADINDFASFRKCVDDFRPEIVFHLAAQPLVRYSYENPLETYQTNVMGTVNVLEACRFQQSIKAIICITSDKCYDNKETVHRYTEEDPMGGHDPYSSSKGCAELVVAAYRNSYFKNGNQLLASVRAGNVIGGGDWSADRLIPDIVKATAAGKKVIIRKPDAVRPWQHVLEPVMGYLMLGDKLLNGRTEFATAWNFGPMHNEVMTVKQVLDIAAAIWKDISYTIEPDTSLHEASLLMLDCSKANNILNWLPAWDTTTAIEMTIRWYMNFYINNTINTESDFRKYINQ